MDQLNNILKLPLQGKAQMEQLLPHRDPMVLVDTLVEHSEDRALVQLTVMSSTLFVSEGKLVASGLIEHMAQAAALHAGYSKYQQNLPTQEGYIAAIKEVEITKVPEVGDRIATEVQLTFSAAELSQVQVTSRVGDNVFAAATMTVITKKQDDL
ncbi:MAG: hypothetical protein MK211_08430 [Flavobacteriales bacterium]|jgi:3-hydroxyacyl-[acyl-carrier-protein] dehydratase|nr:hypothetical protein [Flavobacteriales bacterium]